MWNTGFDSSHNSSGLNGMKRGMILCYQLWVYGRLFCIKFLPLHSCISEKLVYDFKGERVMTQGRRTEFWKCREKYKNIIGAGPEQTN